jgi:hypothetical protein
MFMRSLELFQFSLMANLPIATVQGGILDILNYVVIFLTLLIGEAYAAYIVFGNSMEQFKSVQASIFTLLKMLNGDFLYKEMKT